MRTGKWSTAEIEALNRLVARRLSATQIANVLNTSVERVVNKARREKIRLPMVVASPLNRITDYAGKHKLNPP